jgi:hypothetical protein
MSTFFAAFPDLTLAERVISKLLSQGVPPDDISVLAHVSEERLKSGLGVPPQEMQTALTDASYYVGRPDDPAQPPKSKAPRDYLEQSDIGYGISSSSPNDDVSSVDEMDDSQSAAEALLEPSELRSYGSREDEGLEEAADGKFPTRVPEIDDFRQDFGPDSTDVARSLESVEVPRFGLVMGGGALATAAISREGASTDLMNFLQDEGMSVSEAQDFLSEFRRGKTILAVAVVPGEVDAPRVEELAETEGADVAVTRDAPRY